MLNRRNVTLPVLIFLIFLSFTAVDVFSAGRQEDSFAQAEQLVEQKKYNSAIKQLTELLKENPGRIDDVQGLLTRIRVEKENYNDLYEDLIDTYGGDDVESAYPIIKQLEQLDPNPNEATRVSLVVARETAGFVFNNNRWVAIMEDGSRLIGEKDYSAAVEKYMSGFDLSRDIFEDAGYGNIIVDDISSRAEQMNALSLEFTELYQEMVSDDKKIEDNYNLRDLTGYIEAVSASYAKLERAAELREELKDTADYFILQEAQIREQMGDDKQVHYLIYMDRLLNGRTAVEELEGITGSIELFWNAIYNNIVSNAINYSDELFDSAYAEYSGGRLDNAESFFNDAVTLTDSVIETLSLGLGYLESDSRYTREGLLLSSAAELEPEILNVRQQHDAARAFFTVLEYRRLILSLDDRIASLDGQSNSFREDGRLLKDEAAAENSELMLLVSQWQSRLDELGSEASTQKSINIAKLPYEEYKEMSSELLNYEITLAASLAESRLKELDDDYIAAENAVNESIELINGITEAADAAAEANQDEDFEVLYKYPDKAIEQLQDVEQMVNNLVEGIKDVEDGIALERADVRTGTVVRAASEHAFSLLKNSSLLLSQSEALAATAGEQIFTAEKLKQEGERRIEDSKILTQKAQFAAAKDRLEQAAAKFDESLSYLEDQVLRTYRDTEIARLYDEIQVAENNLVVRQVREFLNEGKASYSEGNFPAAQSVLIKAQSRWSDTNVEPNSEVEYWLTLAQTALSVTSGRIIAATDPLYIEMNQYLNQAYADFQEAKILYDRGNESEADILFSKAEQNILYVQQFFPFNEEARVLNLRISQYRDPERFNEIFSSDFRTARTLIASNPQKAYIDLKDLAAIYPSYAGLQAAITEAEYAAGIKVRPPDPQKLARSSELYQLAFSIVSRNVRSEFNVALTYLDEAISLNPENNDAVRLKDRISTDVGGTAVAVMSNTDQQRYDEAVSEFTAGNYLKARILVENLLKNPVNQRNPKIIDLQERIERTR